ncbi:D-alanyl-D-alanine carboxypeptidase family protein [Calderihabitans maritimus]|nr:D-alanyl-D-alanine carboxypeptidase family protein [Calderihabitans maritimus]
MRKRIAVAILVVLFLPFLNVGVAAAQLDIEARSAILMDAASGKILFEKNAHEKWYPASMTKIMTLTLALEAVEEGKVSLQDMVIASEHASSYGGSQVWLEPGEEFTLEKMLIGIAVGSANDCSVAVAEYIAGSEEAFVEMMNQRARELGAQNTHFANSHGLHDENHYTTAYDMAQIARHALTLPKLRELAAMKSYQFRGDPKPLVLWNYNKLLWWYPGADGIKTGYTSKARYNLTATAERDGLRLIAVVMGVDKRNGHFAEAMKLFNYGFARYGFKKFYEAGELVTSLPVSKGSQDTLDLLAKDKIGVIMPKGKDEGLNLKLEVPSMVNAPVAEGQQVGEAVIMQENKELARFPLVAAQAVERATFWRQTGKVFSQVLTIGDKR